MYIITFSWSTSVARQGGPIGPLGTTTDAMASLNYIFAHVIVFIVVMCVNNNKLAKSLTSQNQQKNTLTKLETPHQCACTPTQKNKNQTKKKTNKKVKNTTLFQQIIDEQWF
jgi:hypothetical protein